MQALLRRAEQFLEIEGSTSHVDEHSHPDRALKNAVLRDILPFPRRRSASSGNCWAVGVTTSPRRRGTLDQCLDSLARAGWPRPTLFVDGFVAISERFRSLPITCRDEPLGAWPHYYLSLCELLMREPLADAYMLVQDDALFFDRENVREYLDEMLWPGAQPGIVSLYDSMPEGNLYFGWRQAIDQWRCGAVALIFPRNIAINFMADQTVLAHRWSADGKGLVNIPEVIHAWARKKSVPLHYPAPSLVQHIGATSAIWLGTHQITAPRRANYFIGDIIRSTSDKVATGELPGGSQHLADPREFKLDMTAAAFPEDAFPCTQTLTRQYQDRVYRGRIRMRNSSAVICAIGRDVMHCLPATAARIERLAEMFARCQTVIFENDSRDSTLQWLRQWSDVNPEVHVISEQLNAPKYWQETDVKRNTRMAYYRNRCRAEVLSRFGHYDHVIVLDADLEGGWSYDGIAHTFGETDWDFVGSYGIWYEPKSDGREFRPIHYDAFAFRRLGCEGLEDFDEVNRMRFHRGDPLLRLRSCFGGLGIYRMECFQAAEYEADDCDHVTLHRSLRLLGFDRLFLNPSQIVLYTSFPKQN